MQDPQEEPEAGVAACAGGWEAWRCKGPTMFRPGDSEGAMVRRPMAHRPASHLMETRWGPQGLPLRLVCGTLAGAAGSHCLQSLLPKGQPRAGAGRAEGTGCEDAMGRTALGRLLSTAPMGRSPLGGPQAQPHTLGGHLLGGKTAVGCVSCERVRSPWPSGVAPLCPMVTPSVACPEPPGQKTGQFIGGAGPTSCLDIVLRGKEALMEP